MDYSLRSPRSDHKSMGMIPMTKLEELKDAWLEAWRVDLAAYKTVETAYAAAMLAEDYEAAKGLLSASEAAEVAETAAWDAYQEELNKPKENN